MWVSGFGPTRLPQRRRSGLELSSVRPLWSLLRLLLFLLAAVRPVRAWESGDLELFDLVEEVQLNFYEFLGVRQVSAPAAAGRTSSLSPVPHCRPNFGTCDLSVRLDGTTSFGVLIPFLWLSGDHPSPTP